MPSKHMFICMEIETEDMSIWQQVDMLLAKEFGLTNVVWGVNTKKEPIACKLPSNLFHMTSTSITGKELVKSIIEKMKSICACPYRIIALDDQTWYHESETPETRTNQVPSGEIADVDRSE